MRYRRKNKTRLSMNVDRIEFVIQEDRRKGYCELTYNRYTDDQAKEGLRTRFSILSCWMNPQNGNAVKAYLIPNRNNPMHQKLIEDINTLAVISAPNSTCISTDGKLIRYGSRPSEKAKSNDQDTYETVTFFDSKAQAIKEILEGISRSNTIGGLNSISFNKVNESVLVETGFQKIDDLMRNENKRPRGVPMWLGNAAKAIGTSSEWRDREGAARNRKQFLDLLNKMLN